MFVTIVFDVAMIWFMPRTEPVSRRERPAKPALSRAAIVDAALRVIEREGAHKLTMRRLATELDTGPASLYVYVKNTTELNAQLIDRLLAELDLSWDGAESWRERLHRVLSDYSALLARRAELANAALHVWPDGPNYLDLVELVVRLLLSAGVSEQTAARSVDLLLQHATASAAEWTAHAREEGQDIADLTGTLAGADPTRHPTLTALGASIFTEGSHLERSRWAIDTLIDGILAGPGRRRATKP
ncbi:TetR/AcrR family transcriptional regulator C-terminal domain-containing protein [Antribacter sp. KLBMP9083]|uniref:TetR/AcrR family transcriptional regulator C-terminal domain-containing protein n=1 Tax=Antribacter soli TaxID=2910976 RepID=A0AA41QFI0_9MICO|nr:TetR/AcrR family transcriptional regulator [Antribacter soli]MCF4121149.1 TetR/AcrR family transcriptional regulator C-terminal domain-containing protein [Antribacter soli]